MTISLALKIVFKLFSVYFKKPDGSYPTLLAIIAIAIAYVIAGKLSYFSTVPPGYACAIWPPAGIALAGLLIYGYRVWPGVLLGSFIVNGLIPELTSSALENVMLILTTLVISTGATLQALVGAYTVKRYAGYPNGLRNEKAVLLFLLYGGVLSVTINPTLSVSMLVATGKTPLANALNNWLTWWSGDLLGVIIFTPLALVWLLKDTDSWRHRRLAITLPIIAMFALTATAVIYEAQSSNERIQLEFNQQVEELNNELKTGFAKYGTVLYTLQSYFTASSGVDKEEFSHFAQHLLANTSGIQALEWAPIIKAAERDAFEKRHQQQGSAHFQITDRNAFKIMVRANNRPTYVPITFVEPYQGNESILGYDTLPNQERQNALNKAASTDELSLSSPIELIQEKAKQLGVVGYLPIYRNGFSVQTPAEKHLAILGYVVGVFRIPDMVNTALKDKNIYGLSYRLLDSSVSLVEQLHTGDESSSTSLVNFSVKKTLSSRVTLPFGEQTWLYDVVPESVQTAEQVLYSSDKPFPSPLVIQEKTWFSSQKTLSSRVTLPFGGRAWVFEVVPKQNYFASHRSGHVWLVMFLGLLLTSLVSLVSLVASGRTRWLQQLISESTEALKQQHAYALLLMNEKEKLSMALEQSHSSIIITDLDANIEYVNQAFINNTGYSSEEIIGQKPSLLKSNKTPQSTYNGMWADLLAGKAWQGEVINLNKQGEEFIELTWISPIRETNGEITHYLCVKEDITKRKQNEALLLETLAAKERAEELAKTKSQFLANMSHEIRTPMNAIICFSELALLKDMPAEVSDYLKNINIASNNLLVILNDILDLSKLEAGQMGLNLSPFSLHDLQEILDSLLINAAQSKGLAFSTNIASDVPDYLLGDSVRLRQVITNLLGNAIKFTSQGAVTLNISLQQRDEQQVRLLFAVSDSGIGISVEQQAKLFLPFSQVDDGYARNFEGTGLGLVISQDLVRLMDGLIKVESRPGLGSCFSFELMLPIAPLSMLESIKVPTSTVPSVLHTETEALSGIKILVAEDDAFNQKIIQQVLKRLGASVIVLANNGSEVLSALEQGDFDVVLMDLHMPIMNGYEASTEIRKHPRYAQLPVIALSASVTDEDKQHCLIAGMNGFIAKPINVNELLSTLKKYLNR